MKKAILSIFIFLFLGLAPNVLAHKPQIIYSQSGDIQISSPDVSQAFYDELKGSSRYYFIDSPKDFDLSINLLVPAFANKTGRYSAKVFSITGDKEQQIMLYDGSKFGWNEYYESFGRDYYLKMSETDLESPITAGKYKIEVFSENNRGKYVFTIGKKEAFDAQSVLNIYWQLPLLKLIFFKTSVLEFFFTPFGIAGVGAIGAVLVILAVLHFLVGVISEGIKHRQAKTLLLTSAGMQMKDEIIKLLQKPAYDITVAFISTAAKPQENLGYLKKDWTIMKEEMGFNVQEIDIEGKRESEVMKLLELKDIIFVEGGNTFYLLKAMRACNFERIIRKLLKEGKVYIGASAGSMVAGRTIQTAGWKDQDKNIAKLRNLKGLNLVPFDIFCHYQPEHAELIKQKMNNPRRRAKRLKILTDDQAILVQGKEVSLIGKGEQIIV